MFAPKPEIDENISVRLHVKSVVAHAARPLLPLARKVAGVCQAIAVSVTVLQVVPSYGQDVTASLSATLMFRDVSGKKLSDPPAGEPVRISVELTDIATGRPPRGLYLSGWIRPQSADNLPCAQVAQAYRATRNTPVGSVDLNGIVVTALTTDGSLVVIDPKLNLQSSNMIAAHKFTQLPASVAVDRNAMTAYATFPDEGSVSAVSLFDGVNRTFISGLDTPTDALVSESGWIWLSSTNSGAFWQVGANGEVALDGRLQTGPAKLRKTHPYQNDELLAVFSGDGEARILDAENGVERAKLQFTGSISDLAFSASTAVVAASASAPQLDVIFLDSPEKSHSIRVGDKGARLKISQDGRFVFVFKPDSDIISIVDLSTMSMAQSAVLKDASVAEVAFTQNAAFLLSLEGGFVAVIDLAGLGAGKTLQLRKIDLGGKALDVAANSNLLVEMDPAPQILAVNPVNQTGWIIPEASRMGDMPPMDSTRLRGGVPIVVQSVDRSFHEVRPGLFETVGKLLTVKNQELVLTTGIGGLTACLSFKTVGGTIAPTLRPYRLDIQAVDGAFNAGSEEKIAIRLRDDGGKLISVPKATFLVPSLQSSWSTYIETVEDEEGNLIGVIRFPHAGIFSVQPLGMPKLWELRSAVTLEVKS